MRDKQTEPNIHLVLQAMRELRELPAVRAYVALEASLNYQSVTETKKYAVNKG